jgi:Tannase-like family of unknown function (DUF6351)
MRRAAAAVAALLVAAGLLNGPATTASDDIRVFEGELQGAPFRVEVPAAWNGTLLLWSHPPIYRPEQIELASDPLTNQWLLDHGYAVAASNYRPPARFAFTEPMHDQLALLDWIDAHLGRPRHTIAWGPSGGALQSVLLAERHPDRFDGVAPLCGVLGSVGAHMNQTLDFSFAVKTLLAPGSDLELVHIGDPAATAATATRIIQAALGTPAGRARLALANALADVPGWARALQPPPTTVVGQIQEQALYDQLVYVGFWTDRRQGLEQEAGGNPSWNTGVDYHRQLVRSSQRRLVKQAYRDAGLDLRADLARLAAGPRISPDARAVGWLARFTPSGRTPAPVAALHATGDGAAVPEHERWYAEQVHRAGDPPMLRQLFVQRGGHCSFTASEVIVTLQVLLQRIGTGRWPATSPARLTAAANALGPSFQVASDWGVSFQPLPAAPAFVTYQPARLLRPYPAEG